MKKILIEKYANNNNFSNEKLIKRSYKPLNIIKCIKYDKKVKSYYIILIIRKMLEWSYKM